MTAATVQSITYSNQVVQPDGSINCVENVTLVGGREFTRARNVPEGTDFGDEATARTAHWNLILSADEREQTAIPERAVAENKFVQAALLMTDAALRSTFGLTAAEVARLRESLSGSR